MFWISRNNIEIADYVLWDIKPKIDPETNSYISGHKYRGQGILAMWSKETWPFDWTLEPGECKKVTLTYTN